MDEAAASAAVQLRERSGIPLTERILARLPGPRLGWALIWAGVQLVFFLSAAASGVYPPEGSFFTPENIIVVPFLFAYAILVSLWGVKHLWSVVDRLWPVLAGMVPENRATDARWPFHLAGSAIGPLGIMSAVLTTFMGPELLRNPTWVTILSVVIQFFTQLPIATLLWLYCSILWGLNQLGGARLRLAPFEEDSSLGLGPFGALAATTFGVVALTFAPLMIGAAPDPHLRELVFDLTILAVVLVLLFSSVYRMHRRMVTEKAKHLTWAKRQYGKAFRAATKSATPQMAPSVAAELQIAAEAERRAAAIQTWPFDVSALRTIGAIVSSVLAAMIARLVLSRIGL